MPHRPAPQPTDLYATMREEDLELLMRAFLLDWIALDDAVADAFIAGRLKAIWHELTRRAELGT